MKTVAGALARGPILVMGAGSLGCYLGCYLGGALQAAGSDVIFCQASQGDRADALPRSDRV